MFGISHKVEPLKSDSRWCKVTYYARNPMLMEEWDMPFVINS